MADSGWFSLHRGWHDHPMFSQREFCQRMAWVWMIENACWKDTRVRVSGRIISLKRGQLSFSLRFLAKSWGWHVSRVRRFINELETDTAVGTATDTGQIIITICNYDKYQSVVNNSDTLPDTAVGTGVGTAATQRRTREQENNKQPLKNPPTPQPKFDLADMILPIEISKASWTDFIQHRRSIKKPLTQRAAELCLKQLIDFHKRGHDPIAIINTTIMNRWQGLFEPKPQTANFQQKNQKQNYSDMVVGAMSAAIRNVTPKDNDDGIS